MFDYSRMEGRFFEPDEKICLIFDNVNYRKLRELPEFAGRHARIDSLRNELIYPDMPRAKEWTDTFEEGIKAYGFSEDQIRRYTDSNHDTMFNTIWGTDNAAGYKIE